MISIIVLIRNAREFTQLCLASLTLTEQALHFDPRSVEYVLVDDCSDADSDIPGLMRQFRGETKSPVRIVRMRQRRHYAYGAAMGLSLAKGECVLFFSHDMVIPAACVRGLLELSAAGGDVIRPRSQHMDGADRIALASPMKLRTVEDVQLFSKLVHRRFGTESAAAELFVGDAMCIKRSVLQRIGVFDTRYFGFMADIDFGLRARRAGFSVVNSLGAWLHHEGSGVTKDVEKSGGDWKAAHAANHADTAAAYEKFRKKWNPKLPADLMNIYDTDEFAGLHLLPAGAYDAVVPAIEPDPAVCEIL